MTKENFENRTDRPEPAEQIRSAQARLTKTQRAHMQTRRLTVGAVLVALALVLSFVESLLPLNLGIPGAKVGLANLVTMFSLYCLGPGPAALIGALRIVLAGLLFGNLFGILYSLAGFGLSFAVMVLLKHTGKFGLTAVSCAGGVAHNLGQILVAMALAGSSVAAYFPYLFACGVAAGIIIGILGKLLVNRLGSVIKLSSFEDSQG